MAEYYYVEYSDTPGPGQGVHETEKIYDRDETVRRVTELEDKGYVDVTLQYYDPFETDYDEGYDA